MRKRVAVVAIALVGLVACSADPPTSPNTGGAIVGPTWHLTTLDGAPVVAGTMVTASFTDEGRVAGSAGCNSYFGSVQADGGRLAVGSLGSTLMACAEAVMRQETAYLTAFQAARVYSVRGGELRVGPTASEATLVFEAR